jgi:hypothetical protein
MLLVENSPIMPEDNQYRGEASEETVIPPAEEPTTEPAVEQPVSEAELLAPSPESQLPPTAQYETNGGPLGCCLGTIVGIFLTVLLVTGASTLLPNSGYLSLATVPAAVVGAVVCGYLGWRIGKRIYRDYDVDSKPN